ncbi:hypothetical protein J2Z40_002457 [Cytobacillus eiseniae]|uniref:Uncharacterized protein n=1 Tax=Cytobacillus eiseniae TaxID=762947 RepID=A0ABS4RG58_9BACI|nr:hypothetical protein [Cytobacillus eiseniae]MBP2241884.1 hypothetical protein [Cytobacillus eiseniae]
MSNCCNSNHNNNGRVFGVDQVIIRANQVIVLGENDRRNGNVAGAEDNGRCRNNNVGGAEDNCRRRRRCCWW